MAPWISLSRSAGMASLCCSSSSKESTEKQILSRGHLPSSALGLNSLDDEPVDGQDYHGSQDRYREASEIEPEVQHLRPGHEPVEETSYEGARHSEEHSDYAPTGVAAWHQQLRDYPRDQPEDYPAKYTQ